MALLRDQLDEEERAARLATAELVPARMLTGRETVAMPVDWELKGMPRAVRNHIARHDPPAVLAWVAAMRELLDDLLAEHHTRVVDDEWFSCAQGRHEAGELSCYDDSRLGGACDCGRDERVQRRLTILAKAYRAG